MFKKREVTEAEVVACAVAEAKKFFSYVKSAGTKYSPVVTREDAQVRNLFRNSLKQRLKTDLQITVGVETLDRFLLQSTTPRETGEFIYNGLYKK